MAADIDAIEQSVHAHSQAMRKLERAVAESAHERPVRLEHDDRVVLTVWAVAAGQQVDPVVRSDCHAWDITEGPSGWHLCPTVDLLENSTAGALEPCGQHQVRSSSR